MHKNEVCQGRTLGLCCGLSYLSPKAAVKRCVLVSYEKHSDYWQQEHRRVVCSIYLVQPSWKRDCRIMQFESLAHGWRSRGHYKQHSDTEEPVNQRGWIDEDMSVGMLNVFCLLRSPAWSRFITASGVGGDFNQTLYPTVELWVNFTHLNQIADLKLSILAPVKFRWLVGWFFCFGLEAPISSSW